MTRSLDNTVIHPDGKKSLVNVGRYQMLKVLGKGNFARVEEAVHTLLNVKVAIKVIDTSVIREDYVIKNLTREAKILSMLRHTNIVRLYETIQCGSVYYLVIELATGGDLYTHIKNQPLGHLDEKTAKAYGRQLVAALEHMHCRGVVHRDLKMENIMLQDARKEQIKIVDFGLSNIYTGDNPLKTHCGSPEYAAPELFVVGKKYGPEVDLWSLGVVFYAMATGRLPFQSPRDGQTSSEERRRQLLVQINRGLTAAQKKSISSMSSEYRNLINRLLMPVAHKRITIQELCFHPWIGNDGKNPTKTSHGELVAMEHNAIIDEIAEAKSTARTTIERDILQSKYGEIGGMYNIKAHVMRRAGSLRAFQARSWTTATSNLQTKRAQTAGILRSSLYQSRVSPTTSSTRTENSGQQSTSVQRRMIFQKSLPASKPSSFSGGDKGARWTSKETGTTSSSFTCHRSSCPVHSEKSASGSTTTPGIHESVRHANKWENNTNRMHAHVITRTNNKSIGGLFDRPVTQPPTRSVEPREIRSYSNNLRSEVAPHRDPIKQWIAEKQTSLEKRDQSFPRQQSSQYRTSTSFQDSIAEYRPSTAAPAIRTPSGVTDQSADRAHKNQTTERRFYRSPAATRPEVRKTRLVLSNGTRMVERNFFSGSSRPFTANESSKLLATPKGTKSPNKLRWMEHLVRGTTSAESWNNSDNDEWASRTRKRVLAVQRRLPEVTRYQNVLQSTLRNRYV